MSPTRRPRPSCSPATASPPDSLARRAFPPWSNRLRPASLSPAATCTAARSAPRRSLTVWPSSGRCSQVANLVPVERPLHQCARGWSSHFGQRCTGGQLLAGTMCSMALAPWAERVWPPGNREITAPSGGRSAGSGSKRSPGFHSPSPAPTPPTSAITASATTVKAATVKATTAPDRTPLPEL